MFFLHFKNKEISLIGLTVALIVVIGFLFYYLSYIFPVPGSKMISMAPFLSFMFTLPVYKINKLGIFFIISLLFAIIMSFISIIMGLAILSAGLLTELSSFPFYFLSKKRKTIVTTAFFPAFSFLSFLVTSQYLIGINVISDNSFLILTILLIITYILGILGSYLSVNIINRYS